jgi:stage III sporulation protein AB
MEHIKLIKISGIICILFGTFLYGWYLSFLRRERVRRLQEFLWSLTLLTGEIRVAQKHLSEAFMMIAKKSGRQYIYDFYVYLSENLDARKYPSFQQMWNEGIEKFVRGIYLDDYDCEILKSVGNMPLHLDAKMQLVILENTLKELEIQISDIKKDIGEKCRIYQSVSVITGIVIVLVLI